MEEGGGRPLAKAALRFGLYHGQMDPTESGRQKEEVKYKEGEDR